MKITNRLRRLMYVFVLVMILFAGVLGRDYILGGRSDTSRPNILLISIDTLRADRMGMYGCERNTTPQLDAFAEQSIVFDMCLAPSAWTLPSTASLLTGLHPMEHGAGGMSISPILAETTMLAELLHENGYDTLGITEGGAVTEKYGFRRGFVRWSEEPLKALQQPGTVEKVVGKAKDWLINRATRAPFFLFLHTYETHAPYAAPEPFNDSFRTGNRRGTTILALAFTKEESLENRGLYDGGIAYTDSVLGKFLADCEAQGLLENTVVCIVSDHGEEFWDHEGFSHGFTLYTEQLHVPLILRLPENLHAGKRIEAPVALTDVFATLLSLASVAHGTAPGSVDLLSYVSGEAPEGRMFPSVTYRTRSEKIKQILSVRDQEYAYFLETRIDEPESPLFKYKGTRLRNVNLKFARMMLESLEAFNGERHPGLAEELYAIKADPYQQHDLAAELPEITLKYRAKLAESVHAFGISSEKLGTTGSEPAPDADMEAMEALGYLGN